MGKYETLEEYLEGDKKEVYYATSGEYQIQYINMFSDAGIEVILMPGLIDATFVQFLESKNEGITFRSIDAVTPDSFKSESGKADADAIKKLFKKVLGEETQIETENLKSEEIPALMMIDEYARRMRIMAATMGGMEFPDKKRLVINLNNDLVAKLESFSDEKAELVVKQIYDLAKMESEPLSATELTEFTKRSVEILKML